MPISAEEKLSVTLRFLATDESYKSPMYQFRIHRTTIAKFVPEVCEAIYKQLKDTYLQLPTTRSFEVNEH